MLIYVQAIFVWPFSKQTYEVHVYGTCKVRTASSCHSAHAKNISGLSYWICKQVYVFAVTNEILQRCLVWLVSINIHKTI